MVVIEEFGIKEQEFSEFFKYEPIYTLTKFGKFLYGDFSYILTLDRYLEILSKLKTENPQIKGKQISCFLRLDEEDLYRGNL